MTLSEWADAYAFLSPESAAQPGKWQTLPYQRGIMDAFTDPTIERVTIMKSARVGYTKMLNHLIGYHIHQDPCPIMCVLPTIEDAQGHSKDEIAPMLRDTPCLQYLVPEVKTRDSDNTILRKQFPGMVLLLVGANSARGFRRVSVRKVLFDEVDGYPPTAGLEGDQIALGARRTEYFWNRQIIIGSTPTIHGASRVEASYEDSDMRRFHVPCPFCEYMQYLKWENIDFSSKGTVRKPVYICDDCEAAIEYTRQRWMVERGQWIAEKEFTGHAGFHIWAAYSYSPNATWKAIVKEFLEVKNDREKHKTFINTVRGETWKENREEVKSTVLFDRREYYTNVPGPAGVLTAAVDVQDDRLEVLVKAWARNEESFDLEHVVIPGNMVRPEPWDDLDIYLQKTFMHESGQPLNISCTVIDSGGHFTDNVYAFCRPRYARNIMAIKGASVDGKPLLSRPSKKNKGRVWLYSIGVNTGKEIVLSRLKIMDPGPGYIHFPATFTSEFFDQLTSETKIGRKWQQLRKRNEAFDLEVYSLAAIRLLFADVHLLNQYVEQIIGRKSAVQVQAMRPRRRVLSRGIND